MKRGNASRSRSRTVVRPQGNQVCRTRTPAFRPSYVVKTVPGKKIYNRAKNAPSAHTISFNLPSSSRVRTIPSKKRINKKVFKKKTLKRISSVKGRKSRTVSRCTSTVGLSKSKSSLRSYRFSDKSGSFAFFDVDTTCGKLFSSEATQVDGPAVETCKTTVNFESDSPKTVGVVDIDKIRRTYGTMKAETMEKSTDPCFFNPRTEIFIDQQCRVKTPRPEPQIERSRSETSEKRLKQKTVICKEKKTKAEPKKMKPEKPKYDPAQDEHLKGHLVHVKPEVRKEIKKQAKIRKQTASETLKRLWDSFSLSSGTVATTSQKTDKTDKMAVSKWNPQYWSKEQQMTAAAVAIFAILVAGLYYFETKE